MERRSFLKLSGGVALAPMLSSYDFYFTRLKYVSGDWDAAARLPGQVLQALARTSSMRVDPAERVAALADPAMLAVPFCYLAGHRLVQFTGPERAHVERYVRGGGFLFVDDRSGAADGLFARSFEAEMARLFGVRALRKLPASHGLFASFYRIDGAQHDALRAVDMDGRVRVLYANKGSGGVRLAVNIIHYALGA